ncbi:IucA/IucC family protein [Pseudomonas gessardii]|uniref:Iron transporter n=1 Tax=Pseudomonas gessardii TaxID=78544 RepID=A0ABS9F9B3_9PSED|nr:IucA/IucC family protein [Pseudomonas gessardii]MBH3421094.1 iron transporter [Pseudomonas gessardii]MCF4981573.1 iron transporter [Pseudomonas gessardii]MCF4992655.1 iron transporter [Pseudomonas gessardii]MCF5087164.1 iron transporter [Pseudomonas gessardii]MCF5097749.1 iron transporter [Pseudomonas gessardii]
MTLTLNTPSLNTVSLHDHVLDGEAERHAIECLLNCYLREYALPRNEANLNYQAQDLPMSLRQANARCISIRLPSGRLIVRIDRCSLLGRCHYLSGPYFKGNHQSWRPLSAAELARLLCTPLSGAERVGELLQQIANSLQITRTFLRHSRPTEATDSLLASEQHQLWGHALHPTPKSREGISHDDLLACSPEVGARFQLHWFKVAPRLIRHQGEDPRSTLQQLSGRDDAYPCHPWEVARVLADPLVQRAQQQGLIEYLGPLGQAMYPTSSVRTLYHPQMAYFMKFSMHVRLTNCVRKNAWYELDSAVALTRLLRPVMDALATQQPGFRLMPEPSATSLDLSALGTLEQAREVTECFGIVYRENLPHADRQRYQPQVAMALFTWDRQGRSICRPQLQRYADNTGLSIEQATLDWLQAYAGLMLGGVLYCLFRQGVALEPHLQNTVIGFAENGLPSQVWIRDLEGTKLVPEIWPAERLNALDERTRSSVYYSAQKAWQRVGYCALVNNLGEAIFHLANGSGSLEQQLWAQVGDLLHVQSARLDHPTELRELCAGAPFPSKENFMTRLMMRADREAGYTWLPSPLAMLEKRKRA